jgi:hypothetical protein
MMGFSQCDFFLRQEQSDKEILQDDKDNSFNPWSTDVTWACPDSSWKPWDGLILAKKAQTEDFISNRSEFSWTIDPGLKSTMAFGP